MSSETEISKFPVNVFPKVIQHIIIETNKCLGFPIDYIASSILFASSLAIGSTHKVKVKDGFIESAALYLAIVGRPGTNKTHPLNFALRPIIEQDKKAFQIYRKERRAYIRAINKISKTSEVEEPQEPTLKKFIISDTTLEALATTLSNNLRGIALHSDELARWFKNFNRYSGGSEAEFWLTAWSGGAINVDRKSSEPIFIPHPFISVAGTIQNDILDELAKGDRSQNGFIDRLLFVIPNNIKKMYWSTEDLDPSIMSSWEGIINKLLSEPLQMSEELMVKSNYLTFNSEAKETLMKWQIKNTDECNEEDSIQLAGAFSKMDVYVLRFALILQLLNYNCEGASNDNVELDAVLGAIDIVEYFKNSARRVHAILDNPLERLTKKEKLVYDSLPNDFRTGEGVKIAVNSGMPERNFNRFLEKPYLFERIDRGVYRKRL